MVLQELQMAKKKKKKQKNKVEQHGSDFESFFHFHQFLEELKFAFREGTFINWYGHYRCTAHHTEDGKPVPKHEISMQTSRELGEYRWESCGSKGKKQKTKLQDLTSNTTSPGILCVKTSFLAPYASSAGRKMMCSNKPKRKKDERLHWKQLDGLQK